MNQGSGYFNLPPLSSIQTGITSLVVISRTSPAGKVLVPPLGPHEAATFVPRTLQEMGPAIKLHARLVLLTETRGNFYATRITSPPRENKCVFLIPYAPPTQNGLFNEGFPEPSGMSLKRSANRRRGIFTKLRLAEGADSAHCRKNVSDVRPSACEDRSGIFTVGLLRKRTRSCINGLPIGARPGRSFSDFSSYGHMDESGGTVPCYIFRKHRNVR